MKLLYIVTCLVLLAPQAHSVTVLIEPDDYAGGTDLSNISPYVTLSTTGSAPVYASTIHRGTELAAGGNPTGPLGSKVFSTSPTSNNEWFYWPDIDPNDPGGLEITFSQGVSSFSLLAAELFPDAGCCTSDPIALYLYAPDDTFIESIWGASYPTTNLGNDPLDFGELWPYYEISYSANVIGRIVVGGESEPTSIDRLQFTTVPVPGALVLFGSALVGLIGAARRR